MKNIISLLLCYCCLHAASAQDTLRIQPRERQHDERLQEIDIRELREVIKQKLSSNQKDGEVIRVRFDDAGNRKRKMIRSKCQHLKNRNQIIYWIVFSYRKNVAWKDAA